MILGKTWMSMFLSWYLWSFLTHIVGSSKQSISWDQLGAICAPFRLGPTEDGGCPTAKPVHRSSLHHPTFRSFGYLSRYLSSFITVSKHRNQAFTSIVNIYIYTYIYIYIYIYTYIYIFKLYILTCFYDSWKGGTECIGIVGQNGHPPVFATGTNRGILETITTGLQVNGVPLGHSLAFCRKLVE
jgi:hypothetical protein